MTATEDARAPTPSPTAQVPDRDLVLGQVCDDMMDGIVVLAPDMTYLLVNPAAARMLGSTPEELVGRSAHELFPHSVGSAVDQACARVLATGEPEFVDDRNPDWDRWYRNRIQRCRLGVTVEFYDVTGQRRAATQQLHEPAVLNQLVSHADALITVKDLDGRYLFANPAAAANAGRTPREMVGRTTEELLGPGIGRTDRDNELEVQRTRRPLHGEDTYVRANGDVETYLSVRFPVYTDAGHLAGTGGIHTDITDWKRTQAELAASERRFRDAFAASSLGHVVVDRDADVVLEANQAAADLLGRPLDELVGRSPRALVDEASLARWAEAHLQATAEGRTGYEVEVDLQRTDSSTVPALVTVSRIGEAELYSVVLRDQTALRVLQRRLVDAERLEAVGTVAGGIAHDVNNVLAAVAGYADLLEQEVAGSADATRHLAGIHRAVERASDFVDRLLAFARKQDLEPTDFDLARTAAEMAEMCRRLLPAGTALRLDRDERGEGAVRVPVRADESQVQQVLLNLVLNARDAMPDGGTVRVGVDTTRLLPGEDERLPPGRYARLRVSDDGTGMDEEVARRCFEPFFTTRQGSGGHGLGLPTAFGIARQSGGDLRVETAPGRGTTFTLLLPALDRRSVRRAARAPAAGRPEPVPVLTAPGGAVPPGRGAPSHDPVVLVVDDDADVLDMVAETLRAAGYQVRAAANGPQALRLADDLGPGLGLLLTDVDMPGMDGPALVARLRSRRPDLPVVLMSGAPPAQPVPGTSFLPKPFRHAALTRAVAALLPGPEGRA